MATEWKTAELGRLCRFGPGTAFPKDYQGELIGDYPFVKVSDMNLPGNERRITCAANWVTETTVEALRAKIHPAGATIFARIGVALTYNRRRLLQRPTIIDNNMASAISHDSTVSPLFFYYLLRTLDFNEIIAGTALPYINTSDLERMIVSVPPLPQQRAIAHILGTLDDKIELNRRVNQTLEAMAQALFKSWFVDFEPFRDHGMQDSPLGEIPVGWEVKVLDDLTDFVVGGDWGKDSIQEGFTAPVQCIRGADIPDMQRGGIGKMPIRYLKRSSLETRSLQVGDIVIEISGGSPTQSTGRAVLITSQLLSRLANPLTCSNFCRLVRLSHGISPNLIYFWLRQLYDSDAFLQYETGTTGIKNFAYTIFSESHYLAVPPSETLSTFDKLVQSLLDQHANNGLESETLAAIRDALLPKLMSGEIRINDAENFVGEVT